MRLSGGDNHSQIAFGNRVAGGPSLSFREHLFERAHNRVGAGLPAFEIALLPKVAVLFDLTGIGASAPVTALAEWLASPTCVIRNLFDKPS
jgi:hypothetical protein